MNKITPRVLRDLDATLPVGTECYLCNTVRQALANYRLNYEPKNFRDKHQALVLLAQKLGRGLNRYLRDDIREEIHDRRYDPLEDMAKP